MLASDVAIAAQTARIGVPNVRGLGISLFSTVWPDKIGAMRTKLMRFTGDLVSGKQAEAWGLVALATRDEDLERISRRIAVRISLLPADALAAVKLAANRASDLAGVENMVRSAVEIDAIAHVTETTTEFWRSARADGLKFALRQRDSVYDGDGLSSIIDDCGGD
jgi:enoyl-CoA hydratase